MTRHQFPLKSICLSTLMAMCSIPAFAQHETVSSGSFAVSTAPVQTIYFRNVSLDDPKGPAEPISIDVIASIKGRVFYGSRTAAANDFQTVGGVRVMLRSIVNGIGTIVSDRITEADGKFDFTNLPAGKYSVEVDPISGSERYGSLRMIASPVQRMSGGDAHDQIPETDPRTIDGVKKTVNHRIHRRDSFAESALVPACV